MRIIYLYLYNINICLIPPPSKIADDLNNNSSYWLYADDDKDATDMKYVAQLNNFDFVNNVDIAVIDDNQEEIKSIVGDLNPSNVSPIYLIHGNVAKVIYFDPTNEKIGTKTGNDVLPLTRDSVIHTPPDNLMTKYAIFIKQNDDKTSKFGLLEHQIKDNKITAENQHTALQYIYIFLIVISILSLILQF